MAETKTTKKPKSPDKVIIEWEKPSGVKVKTNAAEANIKAALDYGWKRIKK